MHGSFLRLCELHRQDVLLCNNKHAQAQSQGGAPAAGSQAPQRPLHVVMMTGFESFNVDLYTRAAMYVKTKAPHITMDVSER